MRFGGRRSAGSTCAIRAGRRRGRWGIFLRGRRAWPLLRPRLRSGRPDDEQHVLAAALVGALWKTRQGRRAGRRAALQNDRREGAALGRRENADIEAELFLGAEGEVHEPVVHFAVGDGSDFTSCPLTFPGAGGHVPDGVVLERAHYFLAALFPLLDGFHFRAVVHRKHIGHFRARRKFVHVARRAGCGLDRRNGNLERVGPVGARGPRALRHDGQRRKQGGTDDGKRQPGAGRKGVSHGVSGV